MAESKREDLISWAALLLAGAAAGFGLGLFFAVPRGPAAGKAT